MSSTTSITVTTTSTTTSSGSEISNIGAIVGGILGGVLGLGLLVLLVLQLIRRNNKLALAADAKGMNSRSGGGKIHPLTVYELTAPNHGRRSGYVRFQDKAIPMPTVMKDGAVAQEYHAYDSVARLPCILRWAFFKAAIGKPECFNPRTYLRGELPSESADYQLKIIGLFLKNIWS
ncbi:hypothetical protein DL93DRAFT_2102836 [Clavulina sp. PMI_390]|nr:hypothetical protein DL93DRAFT_2102836 [Clavulina sp. PMI_390]